MIDFLIKIQAFLVSLFPHRTIVVDTETTGLVNGELLQVALVSGTGRVLFNKFIKPDIASEWPEAQKINHISPKMVKHCQHIASYVPLINAYLKHTKTLIGYNHIRFDIPILERYGISTEARLVDIMLDDTAKRTKPGERRPKWRKLTITARQYGYFFSAHDALEDCFATLHVNAFMHPSINTLLYLLRKALRILVGAMWIGSCYEFYKQAPEADLSLLVGVPFMAVASWSYVYGPIIGAIATLIGVSLCLAGHPIVMSLTLMAILLGLLYGIIKCPRTWGNRGVLCVVSTIGVGMLFIEAVSGIFGSHTQALTTIIENPVSIIITMVIGIPLYFLLNKYLKRVL